MSKSGSKATLKQSRPKRSRKNKSRSRIEFPKDDEPEELYMQMEVALASKDLTPKDEFLLMNNSEPENDSIDMGDMVVNLNPKDCNKVNFN